MPPREWRLRIEDMLDAIGAIEEFVAEMDFEAFCNDWKTVDAVVRNLEVIGEAARQTARAEPGFVRVGRSAG